MAKLAKPKAKDKPTAPKKPSTRSKTGNAACSEAASNWQLSLRGKAALSPDTYQTLAKCRAMNRTAKMAEAQGRTGKLSDQGAAALKGRLQKRFDSGLITQKSRQDRLETLLKQRAEKGKPVVAKNAMTEEEYLGSKGLSRSGFGDVALHRMPGMNEQNKTRKRLIEMQRQKDESYQSQRDAARAEYAQKKAAGEIREPSREERLVAIASGHEDNAQVQAARRLLEKRAAKLTPPPAVQAAPQPARYSLGGKLAPGRGTEKRKNRVSLKIYERSERNAQRAYAAGAIPLSDKKRIGADENFVATIFQSETGGPGRQRFAKAVKTVSGADRAAVQIESVKEGGKYGVIDPVSGFGAGLNYKKQADAKSVAIRMDRLTKRASREQGGGILSLNDVASGKGGSRYQELLKSVVRRELRRSGQSGRASRIR